MGADFDLLLDEIHNCRVCEPYLKDGCRPVMSASAESNVVIIGQAPGRRVHESGTPWMDQSGKNLRSWLGVDEAEFYDERRFALVPMGFCYPGKGRSGDLPPRSECAPLWHGRLFAGMTQVKLVLLVGQYAQQYYLGPQAASTLTETVRHAEDYLPRFFPLPHPSPRNNIWQKKNPWFGEAILPLLQARITGIFQS